MGVRPFAPVWDTHISLDLWTAKNDIANSGLLALGVFALALAIATYPSLPVYGPH